MLKLSGLFCRYCEAEENRLAGWLLPISMRSLRNRQSMSARRTVARACTALRPFLRFLRSTGRLRHDLASCVMAPRIRLAERPPRALPWADVKRILGSIPVAQSPGKRDFAMLLMMALYGLGAAEVLALQLEDVNWQSGVISVRRPKTGMQIELPLLAPIARALTAYLKSERPPCMGTRRIFVSTMIPYRPLTSGCNPYRIREYARKAGVAAKVIGAHAFRHTHASRQIDAGANLKVVSDILGSPPAFFHFGIRSRSTAAPPGSNTSGAKMKTLFHSPLVQRSAKIPSI